MVEVSSVQCLGEVVRSERVRRGMDQRDLAHRVGVSAETLARLERGKGGTVRVALGALVELGVRLHADVAGNAERQRVPSPTRRSVRLERREDRVALELHRAVVRQLRKDPSGVRAIALSNIEGLARRVRGDLAQAWVRRWRELLESDDDAALIDQCLALDERGHDMRQVSPFLGVLNEEQRLAAIAAAR